MKARKREQIDPTERLLAWKGADLRQVGRRLLVGCVTLSALLMPVWLDGKESDPPVKPDARMKGDPRAPVTLVEYSDFTCGFCQKFFRETLPRLQEKYIETGKVRFFYRDFPRSSQGPGLNAAVAARCAGDQDRYWPMHDRLFSGGRLEQAEFQRHAKIIGLDMPAFTKCLHDAYHTDAVFRDKEDGLGLGLRGTPGFLLFLTESTAKAPALLIPGAFPFDVFEEQIDRLLKIAVQK